MLLYKFWSLTKDKINYQSNRSLSIIYMRPKNRGRSPSFPSAGTSITNHVVTIRGSMISFYWFISSNSFRLQSQSCNRLIFHLWTVLLSCDNFKKFSIILSHHTSLSKELIRSELLTRSRNQRPSDYQT